MPSASESALASQRFWDHMDSVTPEAARMWKDLLGGRHRPRADRSLLDRLRRPSIPFAYFYTRRVAARSKDDNLRQVSYAPFCTTDGELPSNTVLLRLYGHGHLQPALLPPPFTPWKAHSGCLSESGEDSQTSAAKQGRIATNLNSGGAIVSPFERSEALPKLIELLFQVFDHFGPLHIQRVFSHPIRMVQCNL